MKLSSSRESFEVHCTTIMKMVDDVTYIPCTRESGMPRCDNPKSSN